jgi:hypothetical protein
VTPPTIPDIPTLVRLEYRSLESYAEFLVSEDGPPTMGVSKQVNQVREGQIEEEA